MICPNCGAEMEQHTITYVCSYCGHISQKEGCGGMYLQKIDRADLYEYIRNNISYIQSYPSLVTIKQDRTSYVIKCSKAFHPLDNEYRIYPKIELKWKALVAKDTFKLVLVVKGIQSTQNHIVITLDNDSTIILRRNLYDEYAVSLNDFIFICNSEEFIFEPNEMFKYFEFRTYSHRFFNFIFDRTKYVYSVNQKLLTD